MKASSNKRTRGKQRPGDFCVESKSNIFVLVMNNAAANLLFAKSLGLENQGEPHSLSPDGVRKQRAAEMRLFFSAGKTSVPLKFCCAAPGMFRVLCTGKEDAQRRHVGTRFSAGRGGAALMFGRLDGLGGVFQR